MKIFDRNECTALWLEERAFEGVHRIAKKVATDVRRVSGKTPTIVKDVKKLSERGIFAGTIGNSDFLDALSAYGISEVWQISGKREVYSVVVLEGNDIPPMEELAGIKELMLIVGSDKRGTIYGLFHFSELLGVSPLHFWGDAMPLKKESLELGAEINIISKEPSVRYRGFFINDEWPCFGEWTMHHYQGFNANMYDHVFELLLRLKGNYLWPAMWSSSFALDGPGEESARLADIYGVIIGNSHHEPCLRASEEWDIYRGEESIYGNEWNYVTNGEGLRRYWADGLKRSAKYESIVTVGMRGERDSIMEGPQSLKENIEVLKDIITYQKDIIAQAERENGTKLPKLLAIYKEVERYFYGSLQVEGLCSWDGLDDIILMFCDDNFGHMRYLPDETMDGHRGGFGMYYHLDYHGAPISYEWINSTPLSAVWEQMTLAYDRGIRDVWIVNVGDLKGNEYPLSYFMDLAYDFETWGGSNPNSTDIYTYRWVQKQFGEHVGRKLREDIAQALQEGVTLIGKCRPEAIMPETYVGKEADEILERTKVLREKLCSIEMALNSDAKNAFYSMIYDDITLGLNLIQMNIYAGKNAHYAKQGKPIANHYCELVSEAISFDRSLIERATTRWNSKWYGMRTGSHVGFRKWNEDGNRYPLRMYVEPVGKPRFVVSRKDEEPIFLKNYGTPECMEITDFCYPGGREVVIELANAGIGALNCRIIMPECPWLSYRVSSTRITKQEQLILSCNQEALPREEEVCRIQLTDGDTLIELAVHGKKTTGDIRAPFTSLEKRGRIAVMATNYVNDANVETLERFGYYESGVRVKENNSEEKLIYRVFTAQEGLFNVEMHLAPSNPTTPTERPVIHVGGLCLPVFDEDYQAGEADCVKWAEAVIKQRNIVTGQIRLQKGYNEVPVVMSGKNLVLEKMVFTRL